MQIMNTKGKVNSTEEQLDSLPVEQEEEQNEY